MPYETLHFEEKGPVGVLQLNRPEVINAMNRKMIEELEDFYRWVATRNECRVLILTGAGDRGFCAGLDMKEALSSMFEAPAEDIYRLQARTSRIVYHMRQIPQPVIAAVHGAASGGGFSFAMASDVRIITPEAKFNAAYINIGLGGADLASSYFLPRLIGAGRANEFLLTGDFMTADEAMALGFASRLVPRDRLMAQAFEIAAKMAGKDPMGLAMTKEAINQNLDAGSLEQVLHMENRNQSFLIAAMKLKALQPPAADK